GEHRRPMLLTGFAPCWDSTTNPTYDSVKARDNKETHGYQIHGQILPVDFQKAGEQMLSLLDEYTPDAVISLGLAAGRDCVTPERIAINCNDGPVDNNGYQPDGEIGRAHV